MLEPPWPKHLSSDFPPHPSRASIYGFHATLVAPFKSLVQLETLGQTLDAVARKSEALKVGPLELSLLEPGFPALIPKGINPALNELEALLVKTFSGFRQPLEPEDLARREPLTSRQRSLAKKWGYPFVLDQFRYHLTLGDPITDQNLDLSRNKLNYLDLIQSLLPEKALSDLSLDSLCLCRQRSKEAPFKVISVYHLKKSSLTNFIPTDEQTKGPVREQQKPYQLNTDKLKADQIKSHTELRLSHEFQQEGQVNQLHNHHNNPLRGGLSGHALEGFE
jgi:hypothetical protein